MSKEEMTDFDFDSWTKIARQNPEKFESMRQQLIDDLIAQTPLDCRHRITGLQWQIDQIRNRADNPMAACVLLSRKMWSSVFDEKGLLNTLQEPQKTLNIAKKEPVGKILPLERNKSVR